MKLDLFDDLKLCRYHTKSKKYSEGAKKQKQKLRSLFQTKLYAFSGLSQKR